MRATQRLISRRLAQNSDLILAHVDSIRLSSWANNEEPLEQGRVIWIRGIEIRRLNEVGWLYIRMGTMQADDVFITLPNDEGAPVVFRRYGTAVPYHVYFQLKLLVKPVDFRAHKHHCVAKFAVRSNGPGAIGITIVNTTNYVSLTSVFTPPSVDRLVFGSEHKKTGVRVLQRFPGPSIIGGARPCSFWQTTYSAIFPPAPIRCYPRLKKAGHS